MQLQPHGQNRRNMVASRFDDTFIAIQRATMSVNAKLRVIFRRFPDECLEQRLGHVLSVTARCRRRLLLISTR